MRRTQQVLIAEDEPRILADLAAKIEKTGKPFQVVGRVEDGQKTLSFLEEHSVEILFTDIVMPKLDGLDLVAQIRRRRPDLTVVIISAMPGRP